MKGITAISPLISGVLLASLALAGCSNQPQQEVATGVVPEQAETNAPVPSESYYTQQAGPLGTEQAAGPFKVVLTTDPTPPKVGENAFKVMVTRDGQPVRGAEVNINIVDPDKSATATTFQLAPIADHYSAAQHFNTTKTVHADVTVISGADRGHAYFVINAVK